MRVTVLVERLDERRYRASTSHPITMESEGCSRDEALERLRDQAAQRLNRGELIQVLIPGAPDAYICRHMERSRRIRRGYGNIAEYRRTR